METGELCMNTTETDQIWRQLAKLETRIADQATINLKIKQLFERTDRINQYLFSETFGLPPEVDLTADLSDLFKFVKNEVPAVPGLRGRTLERMISNILCNIKERKYPNVQ